MKYLPTICLLVLVCLAGVSRAQSTRPAPGAMASKDSAALRVQAQAALARGDFEASLALVEQTRGITSISERTAWWLFESELQYKRGQFPAGALAAMRIVILHPKNDHSGAALVRAARCYEKMNRPALALSLYEEGLANAKTPRDLRESATARVKELKKPVKP